MDHKTNFISGAKCYVFRHQGAIIRAFINNKGLLEHVYQALVAPTSSVKPRSPNMLKLQIIHTNKYTSTFV